MADNDSFFGFGKNQQPSLWGGIGDLVGGLFGSSADYQDPMAAANPYYSQIIPEASPYLKPYINAGQNAINTLNPQYQQLLNNPTAIMNKIGQTYQPSPGYQFQVDQATNAANRAAAAGGMAGSGMSQVDLANTVNNLANQDYYHYLNMGLQNYGAGLQGEQGMMAQGAQSANSLADLIANALASQGNLAYSAAMNQNMMNQANAGGLGGMLGGALANIGGALFGG